MTTVYVCSSCGFLFVRAGEVSACPDCGKVTIRLADGREIAEYERHKAEFEDRQVKRKTAPTNIPTPVKENGGLK